MRATRQGESGSEDGIFSQTKQTSPLRDAVGGYTATEGAYPELRVAEALPLLSLTPSAVAFLRPEDGIHRESRPVPVSVSRDDREY